MARIVLLLGLLVLALFWAFGRRRDGTGGSPRPHGPAEPSPGPRPMVRCAHCGLHLPQTEALQEEGKGGAGRWFCCEDHRAQGART